jgi:hypothetical protein
VKSLSEGCSVPKLVEPIPAVGLGLVLGGT